MVNLLTTDLKDHDISKSTVQITIKCLAYVCFGSLVLTKKMGLTVLLHSCSRPLNTFFIKLQNSITQTTDRIKTKHST